MATALTVGAGLALTVTGYAQLRDLEQRNLVERFDHLADERVQAIEQAVSDKLLVLDGLQSFYAASDFVDRDEFTTAVEPFLKRFPGIQALEWIPRVPQYERGKCELRARQDGFERFQITERDREGRLVRASIRDEYFPVHYVEPYVGNEAAVGFDLGSNPERLQAIYHARGTGQTVAAAPITLVQETGSQSGFLLFAPAYEKKALTYTIGGRRASLKGFVLGVFRAGDVIESALAPLERVGIDVQVSDATIPEAPSPMHVHRSRLSARNQSPSSIDGHMAKDLRIERLLDVAGRRWLVCCHATPEFLATHGSSNAWLVLVAGILLTGMLAGCLRVMLGRTALIQRNVERRASELRATEEKHPAGTQAAVDAIIAADSTGTITFWNPAAETVFGHTADEALGRKLAEIMAPTQHRLPKRCAVAAFAETDHGPPPGGLSD